MSDEWDDFARKIEEAADAGRHTEAFDLMRAQLVGQAFAWFDEAGVRFVRAGPQAPDELFVGLAMAARRAVEEIGEDASDRLQAATTVFDAVAHLRQALGRPPPTEDGAADRLAEVLLYAGALGSAATMVAMTRLGHFEQLDELAHDRERRRAGAEATNRHRATAKENALAAAISILGTNPTLSADEAAPKIRDRASLRTSLRTVADWVREWRRAGTIPPARNTSA